MTTYRELKTAAEELLAKAEAARQAELGDALRQIKSTMEEYGLTMADLRAAGVPDKGVPAKKSTAPKSEITKAPMPPKYRGPDGQLWAGGRGRRPEWVLQAIQRGQDIEEFRIQNHH